MSRGILSWGDFVLGGILSRGILSGGFCPGDFVRGDFVLIPLDTAMQRFTCDLYYRFGNFLAPVSVGIITGKHYAKNSITKLNDRSNSGTCDTATRTVTKQKNPLRIEQGRKLVEYNKHKKEELKRLNEQITKQDDMADHKPKSNMNNYVYAGGLSVFGLAICGYLLYNKFKKQERNLIDAPPPPVVKNNTELKRDIFEML